MKLNLFKKKKTEFNEKSIKTCQIQKGKGCQRYTPWNCPLWGLQKLTLEKD